MSKSGVNRITNNETNTLNIHGGQNAVLCSSTRTHIHTVFLDMKMNIVTFDPFTLIKADFPLSLGRMWSSSYKDSAWDSAVKASPLACGLCSRGGRGRPGWEEQEFRTKFKTWSRYGWLNDYVQLVTSDWIWRMFRTVWDNVSTFAIKSNCIGLIYDNFKVCTLIWHILHSPYKKL